MGISENWSRENLAWAAGIFEGEGCIGIRSSGKLKLSVSMTDEDVVRKLHSILGLGGVSGPLTRGGATNKPLWRWETSSSKNVQAVLAAFWTFLGSRRLAKAAEAIVVASSTGRKVGGSACKRGHMFTADNTYITKRGSRLCKRCNSANSLASYHKKKKALKNGPDQLHHAPSGDQKRAA